VAGPRIHLYVRRPVPDGRGRGAPGHDDQDHHRPGVGRRRHRTEPCERHVRCGRATVAGPFPLPRHARARRVFHERGRDRGRTGRRDLPRPDHRRPDVPGDARSRSYRDRHRGLPRASGLERGGRVVTTALSRANGTRRAGNAETRKVILVLGMHRSGTSAVTRCLNLLGAEVGSKLLPPAEDNRSGFWEHADVVAIHEELLKDLGRVWHDARALPEGWFLSAAARKARDKIATLISNVFDGSALWAVKDPRLCRFVPLWREVLLESGREAAALLVVRHPAEVARSLGNREGLRSETTHLNWLEHFADAETATRGMQRALLSYDGLLSDWRDALAKAGR